MPNRSAQASTIVVGISASPMSAARRSTACPSSLSSAASASPRAVERPVSTRPVAPSATSLRATASPSPWVPPLTIVITSPPYGATCRRVPSPREIRMNSTPTPDASRPHVVGRMLLASTRPPTGDRRAVQPQDPLRADRDRSRDVRDPRPPRRGPGARLGGAQHDGHPRRRARRRRHRGGGQPRAVPGRRVQPRRSRRHPLGLHQPRRRRSHRQPQRADGPGAQRHARRQLVHDRAHGRLPRGTAHAPALGRRRRAHRRRRPHAAGGPPAGLRLADDPRPLRPDHRRLLVVRQLRHADAAAGDQRRRARRGLLDATGSTRSTATSARG